MMKLRNLLQSRSQLFQNTFYVDSAKNSLWVHGLTSSTGISTARRNFVSEGKFAGRVFAPYSIYKGKAALSAFPCLPTFSKVDAGGLKVDRRGAIMLTFWPSIGERKYDWEKRQMFALSATEVGSLISISARDSCEFFHDPSMLSSNAGQVRKSLSIKPHADYSGYFISLSVVNNILKTNERFTVPVTTAEFSVMRTAFSFALPHILGWEQLTNQVLKSTNENPSRVAPQLRDLEWDR